jgi:hypothetical protein
VGGPGEAAGGARPENGAGTAALVLGILSIPLALVPVLYLVGAVPCGVLAITRSRRARLLAAEGRATNEEAARWGFWLGAVGLVTALANFALGAVLAVDVAG